MEQEPIKLRVFRIEELGAELMPKKRKNWQEVNEAIKGLERGRVVEFEFPSHEDEEEEKKLRKELRMVVTVACRRFHGRGRFHVRASEDGKKVRAFLAED